MFKLNIPEDNDYSVSWDFPGGAPCAIKHLWIDSANINMPYIWIISEDGQKICIPFDIRKLVAKLIKEATPRG